MKSAVALLAALAALSAPAGAQAYPHAGLTADVPPGWHVVDRRLTPCLNPIERLTLAGHGALVMVQEWLGPERQIRRLRPRPRHFALAGTPSPLECCAPTRRAGWFLHFRDHGRGFYAYVYIGAAGTREQALAILDSLRVEPRRGPR